MIYIKGGGGEETAVLAGSSCFQVADEGSFLAAERAATASLLTPSVSCDPINHRETGSAESAPAFSPVPPLLSPPTFFQVSVLITPPSWFNMRE